MIKSNLFIHLFKTPGDHYIYDVNTNNIFRVEKNFYNFLFYKDQITENKEIEEKILRMIEDGFLSSNRVKKISHSENDILSCILNNKLQVITLQITRQCNLRCRYCMYSGSYTNRKHSDQTMNFEMAKKGIDFLINRSIDSSRINIGFYGGEPLLEFNLIKQCINYAKENIRGKNLTFNITSNGTIMNDDIIGFFEEHDVNLMISLDGPKEIHDQNRRFAATDKGTFDNIIKNLEIIKRKSSKYFNKITFNAVLDPKNDFGCENEFFANYEMIKNSLINSSEISGDYLKKEISISKNYIIKREYEIFKLFLSKLNRLDGKYISKLILSYFERLKVDMHNNRNLTCSLPKNFHHGGPCIPGVQRLFMNVKGEFFPCERVSEISEVMKIGTVDDGFYLDKIEKLLNIGQLTEEQCRNCWAFRFCTLCAASADSLTELSAQKKASHCSDVMKTVENMMKDYCTLIEFGCDFNDKSKYIFN